MASTNVAVKTVTIATSAFVSGAVDISGAKVLAIWAPVVTSCQMYLRASYDTTSASFVSVYDPNISPVASRWAWNVGLGSATAVISWPGEAYQHLKLETSVAQAAERTFQIVAKLL